MTNIALTIAGSDSSGGAGIQADLKAFSALGVYGASVITAVTAQNTQAVTAVEDMPPAMITAQIEAVLSDLSVGAIKIGMLSNTGIIEAVKNALKEYHNPIVIDPVMVAKSGDTLLQSSAITALKLHLLPRATVLTPNLPEAALLCDSGEATSQTQVLDQAHQLLDMGPQAILMKGGHSEGPTCTDILVLKDGTTAHFSAPRHPTKNTHGTGCTFSAAIAAELSKGVELQDAVATAHDYLRNAILNADHLKIGHGHGPVHHFHAIWGVK